MAKKGGISSIKINSPYILCLIIALLCSIDYIRLGKFLVIITGIIVIFGLIAFYLLDQRQERRIATIDEIDIMTGVEFEEYLQQFFEGAGYNATMTPMSNEYGTDLILKKDGYTYVVQARHYNGVKVGIQAIQEAVASKEYYNAQLAVVITNNYFTPNAKRLAESNYVLLWDRDDVKNFSLENDNDLLPLPGSEPVTSN
ncbi:MAG: restriction endonuclease [bacterium]|nr:restriction endonuclease [bacterium]